MPSPEAALAILVCAMFVGWALLVALAVMPDSPWPSTGWVGNVERALLFFSVASVTRAVITHHQTRWQIMYFAVGAALFEAGRGWIAHRSNGVAGWASSTGGAAAGASLLHFVAHAYFWRWGWGW